MTKPLLAAFFLCALIPTAKADDLPSTKDPATKSEEVAPEVSSPASSNTEITAEKAENKFDVSKQMKSCLEEKHDRQLCASTTMAECTKSMNKADCRKAIRSARK